MRGLAITETGRARSGEGEGRRLRRSGLAPVVCGISLVALLVALQLDTRPVASAAPGAPGPSPRTERTVSIRVPGAVSPVFDSDGQAWVLSQQQEGLERVSIEGSGQEGTRIRLSAAAFDLAHQSADAIVASRNNEVYLWTDPAAAPMTWSVPGKPGLIRLISDGVAVNIGLNTPDGYRESVLVYEKNGHLQWTMEPVAGVVTAIAPGSGPGEVAVAYSPLESPDRQRLLVAGAPGAVVFSRDLPGPLVQSIGQGPDGLLLAAQGDTIAVLKESQPAHRTDEQTGWITALAAEDGLTYIAAGRHLKVIGPDGTARWSQKLDAGIIDLAIDSRNDRAVVLMRGDRVKLLHLVEAGP